MLDTIIIGAGPIGIYSAFYLKSKGLKIKVLEATSSPGGQLNLYLEKDIKNIPGRKVIKAKDFLIDLIEQLEDEDIIQTNCSVTSISKEDNIFTVTDKDNNTYESKVIILATGNGELQPRKLGLDDEDSFNNILYTVDDASILENKNVAIFGGGDSAIDWALHLVDSVNELYVVHRRNEFRAHQSSVDELKTTKAKFLTPYTLTGCEHNNGCVTHLSLVNKDTKEENIIHIDYVICSYGFVTQKEQISINNIDTTNNKLVVDRKQATNVDGIFAIGDACFYENKNYNLLTGLGEASVVANNVISYLDDVDGGSDESGRTITNY